MLRLFKKILATGIVTEPVKRRSRTEHGNDNELEQLGMEIKRHIDRQFAGSIAIRDPDGSARSLRAERVEIRRPGSRGRLRWHVVSDERGG